MLNKLKAFLKKIAPPWGGPGWNEPVPGDCCGVPGCNKCEDKEISMFNAQSLARLAGSTAKIDDKEDKEFYELTDPKGCRIEIYQDYKNEWRWRLLAKNNKIIACAGEGYTRRASMRKSLNIVREVIPFVPVKEE